MADRLHGKVALITGGTQGIGAGIAQVFAREGASVVLAGLERKTGEAAAESIRRSGGRAVYQWLDVRETADCRLACRRASEEFGGLDILVNNAGIYPRRDFEETDAEFWDQMFQINTRGAFLCSQAAIPLMRERGGGSIVNIGSCAAFVSGGNLTAYAISKSALYALTMSMAKTFAREKIRVNWITVGWVMTDNEIALQKSLGHDERWFEEMRRKMPIGEFQTPEDIAASCVFLASDEARHVTGSDIRATGGLCVNT